MQVDIRVEVLRPAEVAEYLRISKALTYRLIQSGDIPSFRVGRTIRIRRDELESIWGPRA